MNKLIVKKILSTVKTTLIAFLLALFVVTCIIINAVIPSESMEKTIMTGDRLIGNRLAYFTFQYGSTLISYNLLFVYLHQSFTFQYGSTLIRV